MVEAVVGDICDVACVRRALRGCDAIVHLAAVADVNDAARDPSHADLVNARGTALLLQAAREAGVARIIYASTIWVYGNGAATELLDEDALLPAPDHFYTATKLAGEMYCRAYEQLYGLEPTILRFGIPHGPRSREATVVATFVGRALDGLALTDHGRRDAGAPVRVRRGPRRGRRVRARAACAPAAPTTSSATRPSACARSPTSSAGSSRTSRSCTCRAGLPTCIGAEISGARAWRELGWQPMATFEEGVCRYTSLARGDERERRSSRRVASTDGSAAAVLLQEPGAL